MAQEAATKIFKSDILQHAAADVVGKPVILNAVKSMICITCHQQILGLLAQYHNVLNKAPMHAGV